MRQGTKLAMATLLSVGLTAAFTGVAGAGEELTKKEFQREADDICETAGQELGAVFGEVFAGIPEDVEPPAGAIEEAVGRALPIFREALDDIEALDGPSGYEKKVDKMVDQYAAVADDIEEDPGIAFGEEDIWRKPDKQAKKLGLRSCVQDEE